MLYTKGEIVKYSAGDQPIRAIVRTHHMDGTVTVEAQHILDMEGRAHGNYLGYKYRLPVSKLTYSI